jgi:hypothetical protein
MIESGTAKMCPYCEGKGHISVLVDLPPEDDSRQELNRTTWARCTCPLCDGKGHISGRNSGPAPRAAPVFRRFVDMSAVERSPNLLHCGVRNRHLIFAKGKVERRIVLRGETTEQVEKLASELRAISYWDTEYRRNLCPEWYETVAFASRQKRCSEIIRDLLRAAGRGSVRVAECKQPTRSQPQSEGQKRKLGNA